MKYIGFNIEPETKALLSQIAAQDSLTVSAVARIALKRGLLFFDAGGSHLLQKNLPEVGVTSAFDARGHKKNLAEVGVTSPADDC
jgi:hypothetical protein